MLETLRGAVTANGGNPLEVSIWFHDNDSFERVELLGFDEVGVAVGPDPDDLQSRFRSIPWNAITLLTVHKP